MEKRLKKFTGIVIMLVMMMATFMSGCASEVTPITAPIEAPTEQDCYVNNVLEAGAWCYNQDIGNLASNTQYVQMAREMSVHTYENGDFDVSMGMNTYRYKYSQDDKKISKENIKEIPNPDIAYSNAKKRVVLFIQNTTWIEDKEELIKYIENIPLRAADIKYEATSKGQVFALFDEADDCVYKNENISKDMYIECAEHLYTHELVHALCSKTNGGDVKKRFCFGIFDEVQTEAIAMSMGAYESSKYATLYKQNSPYAYEYFHIWGMDAIKAYFYGYEGFSAKTLNELDAFAESLNACWNEGVNDINVQNEMNMKKGIASTLLLRWALERGVA